MTNVKLVQPRNALFPIDVTELRLMVSRLVQFWNVLAPMVIAELGIVTEVRFVQPRNAAVPVDVTKLISMDPKLVQLSNAAEPKVVTELKLMLSRFVQPANA